MFRGAMVALVTPFNEDNSVNYEQLSNLVDFHLRHKTDSLVILGTTSESPVLTFEEEAEIVSRVIAQVDHQIPVIVGAGSNNTKEAVWQAQRFEKLGADALLMITPYYNKTNEEGMYLHFKTISDSVDLPIIMYNVPSRTGCSISVNNIERLSKIDNIIGIKEASGDISYVTKIAKFLNDGFELYSGNDDIVLPLLALGGKGAISVFANCYPDEMHDLCEAFLGGDVEEARRIQLEYSNIINNMFIDVNPIPVKEASNYLGLPVGRCRMPLAEMSEDKKAILYAALDEKEFNL